MQMALRTLFRETDSLIYCPLYEVGTLRTIGN